MTTDSKTITLTVLSSSDQAGQEIMYPEGTKIEVPINRIDSVTTYLGSADTSRVTLKNHRGYDGQLVVVGNVNDIYVARHKIQSDYSRTATPRPMDLPPLTALGGTPATEKPPACGKGKGQRGSASRAPVTVGSGF